MTEDKSLELKLCFLHDCLAIEGAKEVLSDTKYSEMLEEYYEEKKLRSYVEEMIRTNDEFSTEFINILTTIRIFLLGS